MTNIYLLTSDTDPVGNAIVPLLSGKDGLRRLEPDDLDDFELGETDVLLVGELSNGQSKIDVPPEAGLIQLLGCRTTDSLFNQPEQTTVVIAGISPVIAPRVAKRIIGFSGSLGVKSEDLWGVIGLGAVGCEVVNNVTSTGSTVMVADVRTPPTGLLADLGIRRQTVDLLVSGSDVISLHVRPGPTAAPLISDRELNLMKSSAVLINTSDSSIVDELAVVAALEAGSLAGYATDCPGAIVSNAEESLISSGRLIVTTNPLPNQIGAASEIAKYVLANIDAFLEGSEINGTIESIDFPPVGDPSFWSSQMIPRQKSN